MLGVEPLHRLQEADHGDLFEVLVGHASPPVAAGEVIREPIGAALPALLGRLRREYDEREAGA